MLTLTCFIQATTEDSMMWMTVPLRSLLSAASESTSMDGRGSTTLPSLHKMHNNKVHSTMSKAWVQELRRRGGSSLRW